MLDTPRIFLLAPSPGQVVRFLERQFRTGRVSSGEWRLSSPLAPHGWRVLFAPDQTEPEQLTCLLSAALPNHPVTTIWQTNPPPAWNAVVCENGAQTERAGGHIKMPSGLLNRLPGARRAVSPALDWANKHGLPGAFAGDKPPRLITVDYETVAGLDQRGLLVETGPGRLYRFVLGPSAETV